MSWKQIKAPNTDPVIYSGNTALTSWAGWCLAYVETAFGTPRKYNSAWEAWQDTQKRHENRDFPRNVYFPIWFSHYGTYGAPAAYGNWGHVAIAKVSDSGSMVIFSSPASAKPYADTYSSVEQIERIYRSKYVGWSEDIARTLVIEPTQAQGGADDMTIIVRPISQLNVKLKKPIQMWNIETGEALWNSGNYMEVTQKTNVVRGKAYYIPKDRAEKGELFGFWDVEVEAGDVHDTQLDPKPQPDLSFQDKKDLEAGRRFRELVEGVKK